MIDGGRIVEMGSYEELKANNEGFFAQFISSNFNSEKRDLTNGNKEVENVDEDGEEDEDFPTPFDGYNYI